ncbi:MAG TPA: YCF48-related protein [Terriglobia bacterium]|nr:YCF48-related protein [Terriglobia bacterium]
MRRLNIGMEELPKIVRHRLAHPAKQDAANAPDTFRGAAHPDANLLSSFVERSLSKDERTAVLGHLADCAECRELVSLAFPAPEVQAALSEVPATTRTGRRWPGWPLWLGWRTLRWGVLAASVAVVMAGAFHSGILKWPAAPNTARNTVAENRPAPNLVGPPPAASPAASPAPSTESYAVSGAPSAHAQGARSLQNKLADQEKARSESLLERSDVGGLAKQKWVAAPGGPASQPPKEEMEKSLARLGLPPPRPADERQYSAERALKAAPNQASKDHSALVANSVTPNPRAAAPVSANEPAATSRRAAAIGGVAKTAPMERDLDQKSPRVSEAIQVQAQAVTPEKKAEQLRDQLRAQNPAASAGQAMAPPPQAPVAREQSQQGVASGLVPQATQEATVTRQRAGAAAARKAAKVRRARLSAYWSISAAGRIERSQAEGGPWSELHVDDSVKFQSVSAEGNDVWAGGSGGALYHSTDGGAHWVRVRVGPNQTDDQAAVTDTIVSLRFSDSEHGEIVTDAHEKWSTADGGAHWTLVQ